MNRREVIAGLALPFLATGARAQQIAMPVIGFLTARSRSTFESEYMVAIHRGLGETGYVEGKNVAIEYRWAEGENDRLPALAADLVRRRVNVILVPDSTPAALAAKAATSTIPIVFAVGTDPVAVGLVASLRQPGGNVTGVTSLSSELAPKWLELLHQVVPSARVFALLVNPTGTNPTQSTINDVQVMARALGLELHVLNASTDGDLDTAFAASAQLGVGGIVIGPDSFFTGRPEQLAALATRHATPAIYWRREFSVAGGLMSYGTKRREVATVGVYVGRILKGEKPADLPIEHLSKVDMTINLKTAKALGLTIPPALLARADEVIE